MVYHGLFFKKAFISLVFILEWFEDVRKLSKKMLHLERKIFMNNSCTKFNMKYAKNLKGN